MAEPATQLEPVHTIDARLRAACVAHNDAQEIAARAGKRRRQLIVEAIDEHRLPHKYVAELCGVSRARLHAIILAEYREP